LDRLKNSGAKEWASFEECAKWLALTEWDERRVYDEVLRRIAQPPFTNQSNHTNQVNSLRKKFADIRARMTAARFGEGKQIYAEALKRDERDFYVRGNYAKLLEDGQDVRGAIAQWDEVRKLMPHEPVAYFYEGKLLGQVGEYDRAMTNLARALEISPQLVEAMDEQSKVLLRAGKPAEALNVLEKMSAMRPNNSRVRVGMAEALARLNRRPEAVRQLEFAIELQPTNWEARYLLGVEFATANKIKEAREQFEQVVRLQPDYELAHLNLGVALAKEQRLQEAAREFEATLKLDPNNARAKQFLEQLKNAR
jgi:tetratricopeptide (TPR) repeat protein